MRAANPSVSGAPSETNQSMFRCVEGSAFYKPYDCNPGEVGFEALKIAGEGKLETSGGGAPTEVGGGTTETGAPVGSLSLGAEIAETPTDLTPNPLHETGEPLDFGSRNRPAEGSLREPGKRHQERSSARRCAMPMPREWSE